MHGMRGVCEQVFGGGDLFEAGGKQGDSAGDYGVDGEGWVKVSYRDTVNIFQVFGLKIINFMGIPFSLLSL